MLRGRRKRCVDSTVFDDAVATQDTVTQLVAAMRKVARCVPGAEQVIARVARLDYSNPGKPGIDWDDAVAKQELVSDLVNDALAVLAELAGPDAPARADTAADALGLLALVAGQDVEPADGFLMAPTGGGASPGGSRRIGSSRPSIPEARHTRKSKPTVKTGSVGTWPSEPQTGLITDAELTKAAGDDGSDAVVGRS